MALRTRDDGFTLMEMLMVTTVFVIIAGMAVPLFSDVTDSIKLGEAGRQVERELQTARLTAVSGNQPLRVRFDCPCRHAIPDGGVHRDTHRTRVR